MTFDYNEAFSRNLGLVTREEQAILASKKVAIAGMGGVGGIHLQTLARMGLQKFHIADMDQFELANFNRQAGALVSTIGQDKTDVMARSAKDINPDCAVTAFPEGVAAENLDAFLDGVDVYVDGLDFFVLDVRAMVFEACRRKGIPVVTAGPVGASVPYLVFDPGGMSFEDYFGFAGKSDLEKSVRFLVGLAPALAQRGHFIDDRYLNFKAKKGASLGPTCMACAGVTGIEVLKLLLNRGKTYYVPWAMQFDMYRNRYHKRYNWRGNNNPLSQMKIRLMMQWAEAKADTIPAEEKGYRRALDRILDVARWAPSGDNCQPWFLTLRNDTAFQMDLGRFKQNVYNLLPMPDYISTGMFIENARIAAEKEGYDLDWTTAEDQVAVTLKKAKKKPENPLYPYIPTRSVNRYVYKPKKLLPTVRTALTAAVDDGIRITWFESFADKRKIADLMMRTTDIRLRLPETFPIHSTLIDWSGQDSADRIPAAAAGVNPLALKMMKWALGDQTRNEKLMKLPGSTASFMLELDLLPGLLCAGHFVMSFDPDKTPAPEVADYIRAGQSMQRFWLTLSRYGMALQPWYIPVMFSRYVAEDIPFTTDEKLLAKAQLLRDRLCEGVLAPRDLRLEDVFFTGRIGYPFKTPQARSVRKPFEDLIVTDKRGEKPAETV